MPPDEINSLNAESLKGLVLSLLGKIDDLHEHTGILDRLATKASLQFKTTQ